MLELLPSEAEGIVDTFEATMTTKPFVEQNSQN